MTVDIADFDSKGLKFVVKIQIYIILFGKIWMKSIFKETE